MKVGFGSRDIQIDHETYVGISTKSEKTDVVLNQLRIKSMAIEVQGTFIYLAVLDCLVVTKAFCDEIKKEVFIKAGIQKHSILILATHTHAAPGILPIQLPSPCEDEAYRQQYLEKTVNCILDAKQNLQDASVCMSVDTVSGVYGNRNQKEGDVDQTVTTFHFYNRNHQKIGLFVNLATHPTVIDESCHQISSDLIGGVRDHLEKKYQIPVCISNGACGDVSTRFYREGRGEPELKRIVQAIAQQLQMKEVPLPTISSMMQFAVEKQSYLNVLEDSDRTKKYEAFKQKEIDGTLSNHDNFMYQIYALRHQIEAFYHELHSDIIVLGSILLVSIPGELVVSLGRKLKEAFPAYHVIILAYANDYVCYMVDEKEYGTYFESDLSELPYGMADEFIQTIIEETKRRLEKV